MISDEQRKEIEIILQELKLRLEKDISEGKESSQPVTLDQQSVGRVSRIDAIQRQQIQLSIIKGLRQRMSMVKVALSRLSSEDFGYCSLCEEPIELKRLKARPDSPLCLPCAKNNELLPRS